MYCNHCSQQFTVNHNKPTKILFCPLCGNSLKTSENSIDQRITKLESHDLPNIADHAKSLERRLTALENLFAGNNAARNEEINKIKITLSNLTGTALPRIFTNMQDHDRRITGAYDNTNNLRNDFNKHCEFRLFKSTEFMDAVDEQIDNYFKNTDGPDSPICGHITATVDGYLDTHDFKQDIETQLDNYDFAEHIADYFRNNSFTIEQQ